jgi:hypothetical protein
MDRESSAWRCNLHFASWHQTRWTCRSRASLSCPLENRIPVLFTSERTAEGTRIRGVVRRNQGGEGLGSPLMPLPKMADRASRGS